MADYQDWNVGFPVNYSPSGDLTLTAVYKHIQEIAKIYGHLNYLRGNVDGGASISIKAFVPNAAALPATEEIGSIYMTNGGVYDLYTWDGTKWIKINTNALPLATTTVPGIVQRGTVEGVQSSAPSPEKVITEAILKTLLAGGSGGGAGVPSGTIVAYNGLAASIPAGWALCDGSAGTPDLRGRFIRGANAAPGGRGGQDNVALTVNNMPSHSHTWSGQASSSGSHVHGYTEDDHSHHIDFRSFNEDLWHEHDYGGWSSENGNHQHAPDQITKAFLTQNRDSVVPNAEAIQSGTGTAVYTVRNTHANPQYALCWFTAWEGQHNHHLSGRTGGQTANHGHLVIGDTQGSTTRGHYRETQAGGGGGTSVSGSNANTGSGAVFDNRPAYHDLIYIMKL
jgi:microcystin-dependent protein